MIPILSCFQIFLVICCVTKTFAQTTQKELSGKYIPSDDGTYIHDDSGRYIPDYSGLYHDDGTGRYKHIDSK